MRRILFALSGMLLSCSLLAQMPGGGARNRQIPAIGHFYGRVVDASTNKGIEAASVQLVLSKMDMTTHTRKDTIVGGMLTQANGDFSLEKLPIIGNFVLKITAIGFENYEQKVSFDLKAPGSGGDMSSALASTDKDLGNIKMKVDPKLLQSVTVTGSKPLVTMDIDKRVFNVEKNITSAGGTAEDVMRNVPSVSVDIDGNLNLRNSTPQLFVDGRPTTLTLDQIPSDAIESVEVITNPSAKYDASGGTAGIINIVLKKNRKTGYNGSIRAGIDKRGKYNLGGDLNVRQGKINAFASLNLRQNKSITTGHSDRLTLISDPNTQLFQQDKSIREGNFTFGRAGFDYLIDNRNTLTLSGMLMHGKFDNNSNSDLLTDSLYEAGVISAFSQRLSNSSFDFKNRGLSLNFKHNFAKAGKEWTADVNYNKSRNSNNNLVTSNTYEDLSGNNLKSQYQQLLNGGGNNSYVTLQTDYVDPISENIKLEMGARAQMRKVESLNDISYGYPGGEFVKVPQLSSQYSNKDNVYAGYVTFTNKINDFGYQVGLRVESSEYSGNVNTVNSDGKDTSITYNNNFPLSLFPSIFLTQKLSDDQELQFNATRRINRPNFFQLFPFTDYSDSLNLSRGNPNLKPEFTYSFELAYQKTYQRNNTFLASVYYKFSDQLITNYQQEETNPVSGNQNLISTYINANSSYVGGLELINRHQVTKWWDLTTNLNIYTSKINIDDPSITTQDAIFSFFGKLNNQFTLPKNFSLQLSGEYRSKTVLPPGGSSDGGSGRGHGWGQPQGSSQGYIRPRYAVDAAIKYDFLKEKRASVTLSFSDIFRTQVSDTYTASDLFIQNSFRRRDPQFFRLNFSWRFGKFDTSLFKRKNMKGQMEGMQDGMQGM